ncbi:hypothetical protein FHG66_05995 [Rubellimicrobium rubrum]|uniref:Uncharacterized protein n=1 Tax=Rubellimicrobium rubrum TaxID=2585369 RepID=A0A5C4N2U0_9RHOB|nr:hypothetical protein [Rubellimicrobium rubrum]TNC51103.1 hypothetical protein FHG66_05995 [Rubellimicrobium rubrum]
MRLLGYRRTSYGDYALVEGRSLIYSVGLVFGGPRDPQIVVRAMLKAAVAPRGLARLLASKVEGPAGDLVLLAPVRDTCPLNLPRPLSGSGGLVMRAYLPELVRRPGAIEAAREAGLYSHHEALQLYARYGLIEAGD